MAFSLNIWLIEDNLALSKALKIGLEASGAVHVQAQYTRGEDVLAQQPVDPSGASAF